MATGRSGWADDARGNRTQITHPDGNFFEYAYDSADRLFHLSENGPSITLASIFYDGEGRRDQLARDALGATTQYGYDPISRLATLSHDLDGAGSTNDASLGFAYNPASQIVTRSLSNNAYEYPVTPAIRSFTVNGRNQYTQVGGRPIPRMPTAISPRTDLNNNREGRRAAAEGRAVDSNNLITSAERTASSTLANEATYLKGMAQDLLNGESVTVGRTTVKFNQNTGALESKTERLGSRIVDRRQVCVDKTKCE